MRGLATATHYYATQQARTDWQQLAAYATANGYGDQASQLQPPAGAGHKTIDRSINALMAAMGLDMPFYVWKQQQPEVQP